jgi:hypothetical protein
MAQTVPSGNFFEAKSRLSLGIGKKDSFVSDEK